MTSQPKIVRLYPTNVRNIDAMVTRFQRSVRSGEYGSLRSVHVVTETEDGEVILHGFGDSDEYRSAGLLFAAATRIRDRG